MPARTTRRSLLSAPLAVAALLLALALSPAGASAATTCAYDAATGVVSVDYSGTATVAEIGRTRAGAIQLDGVACGAATVQNTDTIATSAGVGRQVLIVDLANGAFVPGRTAETGAGERSEIEITVDAGTSGEFPHGDLLRVHGSGRDDTLRVSGKSVHLDGDGDADITTVNVETLALEGRDGNDRLLGGSTETHLPLALIGGAGDDEIVGGDSRDQIEGGPGNDTMSGEGDADTFDEGAAPNGSDVLDGGGSPYDHVDYSKRAGGVRIDPDGVADDGAPGEGDDIRDSFEYLTGGAGDDVILASRTRYQTFVLTGNAGADRIVGGPNYDYLHGDGGDDTLAGNEGSDTFHGGEGDDVLSGGPGGDAFAESDTSAPNGADDIRGGTGVDHLYMLERVDPLTIDVADGLANDGAAGEGDNVRGDVESLYGGRAADVITGNGAANYISGGLGADTIRGGDGGDEVYGRGGNDRIAGEAGNDRLYGAEDLDQVDGGPGDDEVRGGDSADALSGGAGADRVFGETGDDVLTEPAANDGADALSGGDGTDRVSYAARRTRVVVSIDGVADDGDPAGENDDVRTDVEALTGGSGADELRGSAGANAIDGGPRNDAIFGLGGGDELLGAGGDDALHGGEDDDILSGGPGADTLGGDDGTDLATYAERTRPLTVTLGNGPDDGEFGEGDDVRTENVLGGGGPDRLTGDLYRNRLQGGPGDDVLDGAGGPDVMDGDDDVDTASYANRSAPVRITLDAFANDGATDPATGAPQELDEVTQTTENVVGGSAADRLIGNDAANRLSGGDGDDVLDGRAGPDVLDGQGGSDTADYSERVVGVNVTLDDRADDGAISEGDDVTTTNEVILGGDGDDHLVGGMGSDSIRGRGGNDVLAGGPAPAGGSDGGDDLQGGTGIDTASYAARGAGDPVKVTIDDVADDGRAAGEGDNVRLDVENLVGGVGDDELAGDEDANTLNGGPAGDDILRGEGGDDRLDESTDPATPHDDADELFGGPGRDHADYSARSTGLAISLDDAANDGVPAGDAGDGEGDNVHTDVEDVTTGNGTDVITGSDAANRIATGQSNNRVDAGGGDDVITGGDTADRINGDAGNDRIIGGLGNNVLGGGGGHDTFVEGVATGNDRFTGGSGDDVVDYSVRIHPIVADNDGEQADDGQDLDRNGTSEEKDTIGADVEAIKGGHAGDVLRNVRTSDVPYDPCNRLYGGGGDDHLTGSGINDVLFGGEGHDELHGGGGEDHLVGGPDSDTEYGESGLDTFVQGGLSADCGGKVYHEIDEPDGADMLIGGGGEDTAQYRRGAGFGVTVRLDGRANDGMTGERDNVQTENVIGGAGDDVIIGNDDGNWLHGGDAGDDRVEGLGGGDRLGAEDGAAVLLGGGGDDEFDAKDGDGDDTVDGGDGSDSGEWDPGDTLVAVP